MKSCADAKKNYPDLGVVNCCNSCHYDDDEFGYEMLTFGDDYYVCCTTHTALTELESRRSAFLADTNLGHTTKDLGNESSNGTKDKK